MSLLFGRSRLSGAALALLCGACAGAAGSARSASVVDSSAFVVAGYLGSWGVRTKGVRIEALPAERLTHLNYAFGGVSGDGR